MKLEITLTNGDTIKFRSISSISIESIIDSLFNNSIIKLPTKTGEMYYVPADKIVCIKKMEE